MSAETVAALKAKFPSITDRASLDHPAVNAPAADAAGVLRVLKEEHGYDLHQKPS